MQFPPDARIPWIISLNPLNFYKFHGCLFLQNSSLYTPTQNIFTYFSKLLQKNAISVWHNLIFSFLTWDVFHRQSTSASTLQLLKSLATCNESWHLCAQEGNVKQLLHCQNCQKLLKLNLRAWLTMHELVTISLSHSWSQDHTLGLLHCPLPTSILSNYLGSHSSTKAE